MALTVLAMQICYSIKNLEDKVDKMKKTLDEIEQSKGKK
jgi:hypothetical protein